MKILETTNLGALERELERLGVERVTCRFQRGFVWLALLRKDEGQGLGASGTSLAQALDRAIARLGQGG